MHTTAAGTAKHTATGIASFTLTEERQIRSRTSQILTAKEKVQKLLISALLVQLVCFGVHFNQRAGLATAAVNLIRAF